MALLLLGCGGDDPASSIDGGGGGDAGSRADSVAVIDSAGADAVVAVPDSKVRTTVTFAAPQDKITRPAHTPKFEPDFIDLKPRRGVEVVTDEQRDAADVYPDRIEFPGTTKGMDKIKPGQIITAAGSKGAGRNPMGFARRVSKVELVGGKYVVSTTHVALSDVIQGEFRVQITPTNSEPVDLKKLDLKWAADNLYDNSAAMLLKRTILAADWPPGKQPAGLFDFFEDIADAFDDIVSGAIGTWDAIKKFGEELYNFITTGTFMVSLNFNPTLGFKATNDTRLWPSASSTLGVLPLFSQTVYTNSGTAVKLGLDGVLSYRASAYLSPGVQIYAKFSVDEAPKIGINIDAYAEVGVKFDMDAKATVQSGGFKSLADLNNSTNPLVGPIKQVAKKTLLGGDALAGAPYKFVLFVTKPQVKWIQAGPVPVAITLTMQLNLECDFGVQADIKAHADFIQSAGFKFGAELSPTTGATVTRQPSFEFSRNYEYKLERITGNLSAKCGVVPRVNLLLYDAIGAYAGVWGGIHARAKYRDDCTKVSSSTGRSADAVVEGSLAARVAVVVGAIKQPPGTSLLPDEKRKLSNGDIAALRKEIYTKEFPLYSATWRKSGGGLGWCPKTCPNGKKDDSETDVDCGGSCARKCTLGQRCNLNSECDTGICNYKTGVGICSHDPCGNKVQDATETDVDCGGAAQSCGRCDLGKRCRSGLDCKSGYCAGSTAAKPNICVDSHCTNKVRDGDEGGVDCGGADCPKCANGVLATSAADCASGFFNGSMCVANGCNNRKQDGDESDVDCGGSCPARCPRMSRCKIDGDCSSGFCRSVTGSTKISVDLCVGGEGSGCSDYMPTPFVNWYGTTVYRSDRVPDKNQTCASGVCTVLSNGIDLCAKASCSDGIANGSEGDVDCGGGCADKCLCGQRCKVSSDCDALCGGCNNGVCGASAFLCSDQRWNPGFETDVDCGGVCGVKCKLFSRCKVDGDCELKRCTGGFCRPQANLAAAWMLHAHTKGANALGRFYPVASYNGAYTGDTHRGTSVNSATFGGPSASVPAFTLGSKFTIAAWIKPRSQAGGARGALLASARAGRQSEPGFIFFMNSQGTTDLSLHFQTGDGTNGADTYTPPNALKENVWQHVAVTVDRTTKTVAFYVDGFLVNGSTGTFNESFTDGLALEIGAAAFFPEFPLVAFMEELRIYNTALDGVAILALKNL